MQEQEARRHEAARLTQRYRGMLVAYRSGTGEAWGKIQSNFWVEDGCIVVRIQGEPEPVPVSQICLPEHQPGVFPRGQ